MIEVIRAGFSYGRDFSLGPVEFTAGRGSFNVLMGPNGSGKTTLFSLISGLLKPDTGSVKVDGRDVGSIPGSERARLIGTVPQRSSVNFDYTVEELLAMGRYPHQGILGRETTKDRAIIHEALKRLDIGDFSGRRAGSLSGGEYQRVLLARTLVQQSGVLLLDEPGNHLDLHHQTVLLQLLREEADSGKTVIAVLHDLNQAVHYADNGILLNGGKTVISGKPAEFLNRDLIRDVFGVSLGRYTSEDDGSFLFGPVS